LQRTKRAFPLFVVIQNYPPPPRMEAQKTLHCRPGPWPTSSTPRRRVSPQNGHHWSKSIFYLFPASNATPGPTFAVTTPAQISTFFSRAANNSAIFLWPSRVLLALIFPIKSFFSHTRFPVVRSAVPLSGFPHGCFIIFFFFAYRFPPPPLHGLGAEDSWGAFGAEYVNPGFQILLQDRGPPVTIEEVVVFFFFGRFATLLHFRDRCTRTFHVPLSGEPDLRAVSCTRPYIGLDYPGIARTFLNNT